MINTKDLDKVIREHLESVILNESVREWMIILKSGNYDNKRVIYSTDKKSKAEEVFLDYRDKFPEHQFRVMSKSAFRDIYHRFPEYLPAEIKDKLFSSEEVKINPGFKKKKYVYDPEEVEVKVVPTITKEIEKTIPKPSISKVRAKVI